jgi:aryl sulfotransferase
VPVHRYSVASAKRLAAGCPQGIYSSPDEDSGRWDGFAFRNGDIVVSTRSKHGTTWVQTILLLLIHQRVELPAPLGQLSPWVDHLMEPVDAVFARLAAQEHRRVIKTHTPLDGIPVVAEATYVVVARHPLDAAVSLYHQGDNLDRERMAELTGTPLATWSSSGLPLEPWLQRWIDKDADPREDLDSLPGVMWHLGDAWSRLDQDNVVLVHYDDLRADLDGQMRRLAEVLGIDVAPDVWPLLVEAATLPAMRARAQDLAPDTMGVMRDRSAFFRRGTSGAGAEVAGPDGLRRYEQRAAALAPPDLLAWLHR